MSSAWDNPWMFLRDGFRLLEKLTQASRVDLLITFHLLDQFFHAHWEKHTLTQRWLRDPPEDLPSQGDIDFQYLPYVSAHYYGGVLTDKEKPQVATWLRLMVMCLVAGDYWNLFHMTCEKQNQAFFLFNIHGKLIYCNKKAETYLVRQTQEALQVVVKKGVTFPLISYLAGLPIHPRVKNLILTTGEILKMQLFPLKRDPWGVQKAVLLLPLQEIFSTSLRFYLDQFRLSPRQKEVLLALWEGKTVKEIARALNLQESTVRHHMKGIYKRMDVHSLPALLARLRAFQP